MTKKNTNVTDNGSKATMEEKSNWLIDSARRAALVSIGAVAMTVDEAEVFANKLVELGEVAQHDARKLVQDLTSRVRKGDEVEAPIEEAEAVEGTEAPTEEAEAEDFELFKVVRKALKPASDAATEAQQNIENFINKLVERGEIAEQDGRELMNDLLERRKKQTRLAGDELEEHLEAALDRLNVPTKSDIAALNKKLNALSRKIDQLAQVE